MVQSIKCLVVVNQDLYPLPPSNLKLCNNVFFTLIIVLYSPMLLYKIKFSNPDEVKKKPKPFWRLHNTPLFPETHVRVPFAKEDIFWFLFASAPSQTSHKVNGSLLLVSFGQRYQKPTDYDAELPDIGR